MKCNSYACYFFLMIRFTREKKNIIFVQYLFCVYISQCLRVFFFPIFSFRRLTFFFSASLYTLHVTLKPIVGPSTYTHTYNMYVHAHACVCIRMCVYVYYVVSLGRLYASITRKCLLASTIKRIRKYIALCLRL